MIAVESKVTIYEVDGEDTQMLQPPTIVVRSHWNRREFVVLEVGRKKYIVVATDLNDAIDNATRTGSR